jgi:hypothetical protein
MNLVLLEAEVQDIVNVLGQLPTQSGAFPLFQKLTEQFNTQVQADTPAPTEGQVQ